MPHTLHVETPTPRTIPRSAYLLLLVTSLSACGGGGGSDAASGGNGGTVATGQWTKGDLHTHTVQSDDADITQTLDRVLSKAFSTYGLDWLAVSNHLRSSSRDNNGAALASPIPFAVGMDQYETPRIQALQTAGSYTNKTIFSLSEWDMPTYDHVNVGIFKTAADGKSLVPDTEAFKQFQYRFADGGKTPTSLYSNTDLANYGPRTNTTADDALKAINWLKTNYPKSSFMQLNHPSRKPVYTVDVLRTFNDLAPDIFFTIEGMVGNQMEPDRGGYDKTYTAQYLPNRAYGGVDYFVANVGGVWDALLGEGRRIWTTANSDTHFKTTALYSSGYFPGEYAKNYVWTTRKDTQGILEALRSGKTFAVFGDLINALEFQASSGSGKKDMGGNLSVANGQPVTLTIRFKSPPKNNYEKPIDSGNFVGVPVVDHVDLIAGDVTTKASPGTPAYSSPTNASTKVVKRFTKADWSLDAQGYYTVSTTVTAGKNQYFRLRGTNLGTDVQGLTVNGDPQPDQKITTADNAQRFNDINDRNYASLWFYSNPIFVTVQ